MAKQKKDKDKAQNDAVSNVTGLNTRQEAFCRFYLTEFNGKQAAISAGYGENGAAVQSTRMLKNANVRQYLAKLQKPALEKFEVTQERIMEEVARMAFTNIDEFITVQDDGTAYIDMSNLNESNAAALAGFEVVELPPQKYVEDGEEVVREVLRVKVKMRDKWAPLESLMKRHNLAAPDKLDISVTSTFDKSDRKEMARQIAFMLRKTAEDQKKQAKSESLPASGGEAVTPPVG